MTNLPLILQSVVVLSVVIVFTFKFVVVSIVVPPLPPVEDITPSVMSIFVPADNEHDISSPSMVVFAPVFNSFCLSPIKVETLLPFNNIELVFNELKDQVPSSSLKNLYK